MLKMQYFRKLLYDTRPFLGVLRLFVGLVRRLGHGDSGTRYVVVNFKGVFGGVSTKVHRWLLGKYPTEVLGKVRYGLNTLPKTPVRFGMVSIPYRALR